MPTISSIYFIFNNRKNSCLCSPSTQLTYPRYGPHKLAKILHNAFCIDSISFTIFDSAAQPPTPQRTLSDLASPLSGPPRHSPSASEHLDFALTPIPISTPEETVPPELETPISPPETPLSEPHPPINEKVATVISTPVEEQEKVEEKEGLRVLLVEDNEINLKLLIATMRKLKLEHATATNGLEAFNSYKEKHGKFDVVFMGTLFHSLPFSRLYLNESNNSRYLHAHNVRHRVHTPHPTLRERARLATCSSYRADRSSEPEYQAGSV